MVVIKARRRKLFLINVAAIEPAGIANGSMFGERISGSGQQSCGVGKGIKLIEPCNKPCSTLLDDIFKMLSQKATEHYGMLYRDVKVSWIREEKQKAIYRASEYKIDK